MNIGIISDIHENFHNLILALEELQRRGVGHILCLGDLMNEGVAKVLAISDIPVFMIWGNNDGEVVGVVKAAQKEGSALTVSSNTYDFIEVDGRSLFITHYDDLARPMAQSGRYDAVFYGHTHLAEIAQEGECLIVNPGEIAAQKTGKATLAVYDTESNIAELVELEGSVSLKTPKAETYLKANKDRLAFRSAAAFRL